MFTMSKSGVVCDRSVERFDRKLYLTYSRIWSRSILVYSASTTSSSGTTTSSPSSATSPSSSSVTFSVQFDNIVQRHVYFISLRSHFVSGQPVPRAWRDALEKKIMGLWGCLDCTPLIKRAQETSKAFGGTKSCRATRKGVLLPQFLFFFRFFFSCKAFNFFKRKHKRDGVVIVRMSTTARRAHTSRSWIPIVPRKTY